MRWEWKHGSNETNQMSRQVDQRRRVKKGMVDDLKFSDSRHERGSWEYDEAQMERGKQEENYIQQEEEDVEVMRHLICF